MIIVKLKGGLGNQMFQYAFGRNLSILKNVKLKIDIEEYNRHRLREYSLDCFNIFADIASAQDLKKVDVDYSIINKIYKKIIKRKSNKHLIENIEMEGIFYSEIFDIEDDIYLDGYWQNEGYFKNIEPIIKKDFSFKTPPSGLNKDYLERIKNSNSVSVHIRRGDYVNNHQTLKVHGLLDLSYYNKTISIIRNKIKNPVFFAFSDDIDWAKKNLDIDGSIIFVNHNNEQNAFEDLRLMINCKHNIIANSSFSWWGAWLNDNQNKVIIAPRQWFSKEEMKKRKSFNIVPLNWIKI